MPCYTVRTYEVEAGKLHADLLVEALEAMGWSARRLGDDVVYQTKEGARGRYSAGTGRFATQGAEVDVAAVKQQYARRAVERAAKRVGWNVKQGAGNKLVLRRRR